MSEFNLTIQTKRLLLRPFRYSDLDSIHQYASNPEITKYMLFGPNIYEETSDFVHLIIDTWYKEVPMRHYEMVVEKDGEILGAVSIHLSEDLKEGEMGWISHKEYWGCGYITEAAKALMEFAIIELKVKKIIAHCDSRNIGSIRVMEKIGLEKVSLTKNVRKDRKTLEYICDELKYELIIK